MGRGLKNPRYEGGRVGRGLKNPRYEGGRVGRGLENPRYEENGFSNPCRHGSVTA